jgi:AraC-like DNA-binding protein
MQTTRFGISQQAFHDLISPEALDKATVRMQGEGAAPVALPPRVLLQDRRLAALLGLIRKGTRGAVDESVLALLEQAGAAHFVQQHAVLMDTNTPSYHPRCSRRKVQQVEDYVRANLSNGIRGDDIARHAGMSRAQFMRCFKARTGMTVHQFVMNVRVREAKALLADGRLNLAEIAARTGFANPSHFANSFQRLVQVSPSAYRAQVFAGAQDAEANTGD